MNRPLASRLLAAFVATLLAAGLLGVATATPAHAATPIMGKQRATVDQMVRWYATTGKKPNLPVTIRTLARLFLEEGAAEGVRGDIAFAQSIVETGYFTFPSNGQVRASHNNYAGIGAVDGGNTPNRFSSPRAGVRAQIQHLRAYADRTVTAGKLRYPLIDPRFKYVSPKGKAPTWEQLSGTWASDRGYGAKILAVYAKIAPGTTASSPAKPAAPKVAAKPRVNGQLVRRASDGRVFVLEAGKRRPIPHPSVLASHGWSRAQVSPAAAELRRPAGPTLWWRPGTLLRTPDGTVWRFDGTRRRPLSPAVFATRGYAEDAIVSISQALANQTATGPALGASGLLHGDAVRFGSQGAVFEVRGGGASQVLRKVAGGGVGTQIAASRYGPKHTAAVANLDASTPRPPSGATSGFRPGTLLRTPDGKVWLVTGLHRRHVANRTALAAYGLAKVPVVKVSKGLAAVHKVGSPLR